MKNSQINRNQKGFSLVEILLVIGIIIALAIAAFVLYPRVQASQQANQESQNITAVLAQTKQVFSNGVYDGLNKGVANQARVFPSSMNGNNNGSTAAISNIWNGTVDLGDITASSSDGSRQFALVYNGVPAEPCARLVTGVGQNVDKVAIVTTAPASPSAANTAATGAALAKASNAPVNQATAAQLCASGTSGAPVSVIFISN